MDGILEELELLDVNHNVPIIPIPNIENVEIVIDEEDNEQPIIIEIPQEPMESQFNPINFELANINNLYRNHIIAPEQIPFNPPLLSNSLLITLQGRFRPCGLLTLALTFNDCLYIITSCQNFFIQFFTDVILQEQNMTITSNALLGMCVDLVRKRTEVIHIILIIESDRLTIYRNDSQIVDYLQR